MPKTKTNKFEIPRSVIISSASRNYASQSPDDPIIGLTPLIPGMGTLTRREQDQIIKAELKAARRARLLVEAANDQDRIESGESRGGTIVEQKIRGALGRIGLVEAVSTEEVEAVRSIGKVEEPSAPNLDPIKFVDTPPKE